jgi:hypothetical protein
LTFVNKPGLETRCNLHIIDSPEGLRMKTNVGGLDRAVRAVVGLVLIGLTLAGAVGWWGWLGIVPLATAAIGWCPPYALLGWNTCSIRNT